MAFEIERKFLVTSDEWRALGAPVEMRQGYLARQPNCVVRVRAAGERGWLTVKGPSVGFTRREYEVEIPLAEALEMLDLLCVKPLIEKRRTRISAFGLIWEVDEFLGENLGLIVAEVELSSAEQAITLPAWMGAEVTADPRYYNSNLLIHPFQNWPR